MPIAVTCPSGHQLIIADNMAGRAGRCPFCREVVNVPPLAQSTVVAGSPLPVAIRSEVRLPKDAAVKAPRLAPAQQIPPPLPPPFASTTAPPAAIAPAAAPSTAAPSSAVPPVAPPPVAMPESPDPAAADTVLFPLELGDFAEALSPGFDGALGAGESESPELAEPDLMAQTLPLPTAELMPRQAPALADLSADVNLDTVGYKARIIGPWKVLGDAVPPYVPEQTSNHAAASSVATANGEDGAAAAKVFAAAELASAAPPELLPRSSSPPPVPASVSRARAPSPQPIRQPAKPIARSKKSHEKRWSAAAARRQSAWPLRRTVYRIAAAMVVVALFSMWPGMRYWDLGVAPGWSRAVLLIGILEIAYAAWLISIPACASLWATMFVLATVATLYGTAAAMTLATPIERDPPLGLQPIRGSAPVWCFAIMLLTISIAYVCGHAAQRIGIAGRRANGEGTRSVRTV